MITNIQLNLYQYRDCHPSTQLKDDSIAFNPSLQYSITVPLFCFQSVLLQHYFTSVLFSVTSVTALPHLCFVFNHFCYSFTSPLFCCQSLLLQHCLTSVLFSVSSVTALPHLCFVVNHFCYSITSPLFCCQSVLFPRLTCIQGQLDKQSVDSSDSGWKDRYQHWLCAQKTQRHPRLLQILVRDGYVWLFCLACLSLCLCLLSKLRYIVDIDTRTLFFNAHIKPHIDYASSHEGQM